MSFQSVKRLLKGMFAKPLSQLPSELRLIAESYIPKWDALTAIERRVKAQEIDQLRKAEFDDLVRKKQKQAEQDPRHLAEESTGWYDETLNADILWKMPDIEPKAAAAILCGHNPLDSDTNPDAPTTEEGQATRELYRRLLATFQSTATKHRQARTLRQWRDIAREYGLKCHPWIDGYALAMPSDNYGSGISSPPTVDAGTVNSKHPWAPEAVRLASEYITAWREEGYEPTKQDAALYIEGGFSTRSIYGTRGKVLDAAYIERWGLAGITGRSSGFKSKKPKVPEGSRGKLPARK